MVIRSNYFEPRDLDLGQDDIVVLACVRNEAARLPYFLEYYRRCGVSRFLCVDNGSTDGSGELLRDQPDVEVFATDASYRGSAAGRLWLQELADTYTVGHWTLTVDIDELLVYPGSEVIGLPGLCRYLDRRGYAGLFTVMLDLYSNRPFADTHYVPGTPFTDSCEYFETESYSIGPSPHPPFLGIHGGPRGRLYASSEDSGPSMKKVPLVKWHRGFSYIRSTHSHRHIPLADITGVLLHFKFFATFEQGLRTEYNRGDRRQNHVYARYIEQIGPDTCFFGEHSHRYRSPGDLVARGVMATSPRWRRFCGRAVARRGRATDVDDLLPEPPARPVGLEALASIWPILNNPQLTAHTGLDSPQRPGGRARLVSRLRNQVHIAGVEPRRMLIVLGDNALHGRQSHDIHVVARVGDEVVGVVAIDGTDDVLEIVTDALEPNVSSWPLDIEGALGRARGPVSNPVSITAHLVDGLDPHRPLPRVGDRWEPPSDDSELFAALWRSESCDQDTGITGRIEGLDDGVLTGWVFDERTGARDVPVNVYANGRLAVHVVARPPMDEAPPTAATGSGRSEFSVPLPIGYFADLGASELVVDVRAVDRNVVLGRSPLTIPSTARSAAWDDSEGWQPLR